MTRRQIIARSVIAIIIALAIAASGLLDGPSDPDAAHESYNAARSALAELQASAPASARREVAARRLCWQERGPGATAHWTGEGHLVCRLPSRITTINHLPAKADHP